MILALRTDKPEAELYLLQPDGTQTAQKVWEAGNKLSVELLAAIKSLMDDSDVDFKNLTGVLVFKGPGSFTGLRIGLTVANTLAYSLGLPIVGGQGESWMQDGLATLSDVTVGEYVMPEYGAAPHITKARK